MIAGKETSRKTLPTSAGLNRFCPIPPNVIFATPIATKEPMNTIHQGEFGGRLRASSKPVRAAE